MRKRAKKLAKTTNRPAKGVPDSVNESDDTVGIPFKQIPGPHPAIALRKHVPQKFLLRRLLIAVVPFIISWEDFGIGSVIGDTTDGFAGFTSGCFDTEPVGTADRNFVLDVELDDDRRSKELAEQGTLHADDADSRSVGGSVEHRDVRVPVMVSEAN